MPKVEKKKSVDTKAEKFILMNSSQCLEQISNDLGIKVATLKKFMKEYRPEYFQEQEELRELRAAKKQKAEKEVADKEFFKKAEEEKKEVIEKREEALEADNNRAGKLMARQFNKDRTVVRSTIMTPAASEMCDATRSTNKLLPDTVVHRMKK